MQPTNTTYTLKPINEQLMMVVWHRIPDFICGRDFLEQVKHLLDEAIAPQYFLFDVRTACIVNRDHLQQLSQLARHNHFGGSASVTVNAANRLFVDTYRTYLHDARIRHRHQCHGTIPEALAFLEELHPGVTANFYNIHASANSGAPLTKNALENPASDTV